MKRAIRRKRITKEEEAENERHEVAAIKLSIICAGVANVLTREPFYTTALVSAKLLQEAAENYVNHN